MPKLDADQRQHLSSLWTDLREANHEVRKADKRWNKINDEINNYLERERITDLVQREKIKSASLALADALGTGSWWRSKAVWLANAILAEKAAMEMMEGSTQWSR